MQIADVFACVRLLSDIVASLPLVAYRRLADGDRERFSGRLDRPARDSVTRELSRRPDRDRRRSLEPARQRVLGKYRDSDGLVAQLAPLQPAGMTVTLREGVPQYRTWIRTARWSWEPRTCCISR